MKIPASIRMNEIRIVAEAALSCPTGVGAFQLPYKNFRSVIWI